MHSTDLVPQAAAAGFRLYLCGHTHGDQICLPGGRVIVSRQDCGRHFAAGLWRQGAMIGYTNSGDGTAVLPLRFNRPGEAALLELRRPAGARSCLTKAFRFYCCRHHLQRNPDTNPRAENPFADLTSDSFHRVAGDPNL